MIVCNLQINLKFGNLFEEIQFELFHKKISLKDTKMLLELASMVQVCVCVGGGIY